MVALIGEAEHEGLAVHVSGQRRVAARLERLELPRRLGLRLVFGHSTSRCLISIRSGHCDTCTFICSIAGRDPNLSFTSASAAWSSTRTNSADVGLAAYMQTVARQSTLAGIP